MIYQVSLCTCGKLFTQRILVGLGVILLLLGFFVFNLTGPFLSHLFLVYQCSSVHQSALFIFWHSAKCSYSMIPNHLNGKCHISTVGGFPYTRFLVLSSLWLLKECNCSIKDWRVGVFCPFCQTWLLDFIEYIQNSFHVWKELNICTCFKDSWV